MNEKINYKKVLIGIFLIILILTLSFFVIANKFGYNYLEETTDLLGLDLSKLNDDFVKYQNSIKNVNLTNLTLQIRLIKFDDGNFACDLSRNGTICSNNTGTYIVG